MTPEWVHLGGETMGTRWSVQVAVPARTDLRALHQQLETVLERIVRQMSHWQPDSELSRFNRAAAGSWHGLEREFRTVMRTALEIAQASGGAFSPALGQLISTQQSAEPMIDWRALQFNAAGELLQPGGLSLDLSAIAKGFAADCLRQTLRERGYQDVLAEVGGELAACGNSARGAGWNILLDTDAEQHDSTEPRVLNLRDCGVATSGDCYVDEPGWVSQTWDPRSQRKADAAVAAVTVVHQDAMHADAWATALTVMGPDAGPAYARKHGMAARFLLRRASGGTEIMTEAFQELLLS